MSATNRGAPGIDLEAYPTPAWCVRRLLEVAPWRSSPHCFSFVRPKILEPCAGDGAIVRAVRGFYPSAHITAADVRQPSTAQVNEYYVRDATVPLAGPRGDLCITNPPFSLWHDIAVAQLPRTQWLALLLRIGAAAHLGDLPTPSLYVLPDRPQFVALWKCAGGGKWNERIESPAEYIVEHVHNSGPCGWQEYRTPDESTRGKRCPECGGKIHRTASDGSEYAWFVWGPQEPKVHILAHTPLSERKGAGQVAA